MLGSDRLDDRIGRFLDATIQPLLHAVRHEGLDDVIYAWDLIDEPDWCVERGHVTAAQMNRFLHLGVDRIIDSRFKATIGFVRPNADWLSPELKQHLAGNVAADRYMHQFHHYPDPQHPLLPAADDASSIAVRPCIVGEFGMTEGRRGRPWREPSLREAQPAVFLLDRMRLLEAQGYQLALLWGLTSLDFNIGLDDETKAQIAYYTGGRQLRRR